MRDPPGKVPVTYRGLQYHSNSHNNNANNYVRLNLTHSPSKRFASCIYKASLIVIGLQLFNKKIIQILHFPPNLTSDDPWPRYITFDLINIQKNPYCTLDPSLVKIGLQLFKGDPNNKKPTFSTKHDLKWPLTSLTYEGTPIASLTQVWFQSDFNFSKENQLTKTLPNWNIHIHRYTYIHTQKEFAIAISPYCFSSQGG